MNMLVLLYRRLKVAQSKAFYSHAFRFNANKVLRSFEKYELILGHIRLKTPYSNRMLSIKVEKVFFIKGCNM